MNPLGAAMTGASTTAPMTDPKNSEAMNEELNLEELENAAGGIIADLPKNTPFKGKKPSYIAGSAAKKDTLGYEPKGDLY